MVPEGSLKELLSEEDWKDWKNEDFIQVILIIKEKRR